MGLRAGRSGAHDVGEVIRNDGFGDEYRF